MDITNLIPVGSRRRISPAEIVVLTADVNYTQILLSDGRKMTVATTLKILEKRFSDCSEFFRTHKSYLINLKFVKQYNSESEESFVQMKNDYRVTISRRKKKAFQKMISTISQNI